jgi:hypothetical protein
LLENFKASDRIEEPQAMKILRTGTSIFVEDIVKAEKENKL